MVSFVEQKDQILVSQDKIINNFFKNITGDIEQLKEVMQEKLDELKLKSDKNQDINKYF